MLNNSNFGKYIALGLVALVVLVFVAIGWTIANPPKEKDAVDKSALKAQAVKELARTHINDISGQKYNSNPPSSGVHFPLWAKRGVYTNLISDGYLIHSLEHGYVVLSYNCGQKGSTEYKVSKKDDKLTVLQGDEKDPTMRPFTPDTAPNENVPLPQAFGSDACKALTRDLSQFLDTYQRIVIAPRPDMDSAIALTAWGQIDKMDAFDQKRIAAFIDAFHNKGPEQTVE